MNSSSASGAVHPVRRKHAVQPVYLLDVSAGADRRTVVHGALWDGVLNATPDDDIDGPSPIEALLAAVAACFVRNLHSTAESAHIVFDRVELHLAAERSDDPPAVTVVRLDAELSTSAPLKTASRVVELALRYGTITRTVARASRFEVRASINGTALEVPDVH
jgi:uncharacterized OsmC-like protein